MHVACFTSSRRAVQIWGTENVHCYYCSCLKAQNSSTLHFDFHCLANFRAMPPKKKLAPSSSSRNQRRCHQVRKSTSAPSRQRSRARDESGGGNKQRCQKRYFVRLLKRKVKETSVGADEPSYIDASTSTQVITTKEAETQFEYPDALRALAMYRNFIDSRPQ